MKLEAGRFYLTNTRSVIECLAVWTKPDSLGNQATVQYVNGNYSFSVPLDGNTDGLNIVADIFYHEPESEND